MTGYVDEFTERQTMNELFFEFFHFLDLSPPSVGFHFHDFFEVFFFLSGDVRYTVEGRCYNLRPGDILLTKPHDLHHPEVLPGKPYERYVLWVNERFVSHSRAVGDDLSACFHDADQRQYKLIRPDGETLTKMRQQCWRIAEAQRSEAFGAKNLLYSAVADFVVYLNRAYFETPDSIRQDITENDTINEIVSYLEAHLSSENLSVNVLAERFHLSKFHLNRKFKQFTGLTPYQYILKKRLITARTLLRSGVPVLDSCMSCGFGDYSNFLKAFKREFGSSPKNYRPQV